MTQSCRSRLCTGRGRGAKRHGARAEVPSGFERKSSGKGQVGMSTYRLYKSPEGDIVRVKMGFSWQAFFVGSLSAIVKRTWLLAAVAFLYYMGETLYNGP